MKQKIIIFVVIMIFLSVVMPLIIHYLFKIEALNDFFVAVWSAGDVLGYYAAILSFVSTILLSVLTLWQNEIIRRESNRNNDILKEMEIQKNQPFFKATILNKNTGFADVCLKIQNISDNVAVNPVIRNVYIDEKEKNVEVNYQCELPENVMPKEFFKVQIFNKRLDKFEHPLVLEFKCQDIYGNDGMYRVMFWISSSDNINLLVKKVNKYS